MRTKLYSCVAAGLLAFTAIGAQAQITYYQATKAYETSVSTGQDYGLQSAADADYFLAGTELATVLTGECVYQFIETGETVDGNALYYIWHAATESYVAEYTRVGVAVTYTTDISAAGKFTVLESVDYEDGVDGREGTGTSTGGETVVITAENLYNGEYVYICSGENTYPTFGTTLEYNAVSLLPIAQATGLDLVTLAVKNFYPNGLTYITYGTNPGDVDETAYNEALAAYETAQAYIKAGEVSDEDATANAALLESTYAALESTVVPFREGYYYMLSAYGFSGNAGGYVAYEEDDAIYWGSMTFSESPELDDAVAIWHFTENIDEDGDTAYYVQNFYYGNYAGTTTSYYYTAIPMTSSPEVRQTVVPASAYSGYELGWFNIYDPETWGDNSYVWDLHNYGVVYFARSSSSYAYPYSLWKFVEVSDENIEALTEAVAQNQLNTTLSSLYSDVQSSWANAHTLVTDATMDGDFSLTEEGLPEGLVTSESQFSSNALESGSSFANLLDNDFSTFMHTRWTAAEDPVGPHYLDMDLQDVYDCITIKYSKRNSTDATANPKDVIIYGSNDKSTWTTAGEYTLTYPYDYSNDTGSKTEAAGVTTFILGDEYQYVRMAVTSITGAETGNKYTGNYFWYLTELRVYKSSYEEEGSAYEQVSEDVRTELETAMSEAKTAINSEAATQEIIDRLQAAYDAFLLEYADPDQAVDAYEEAMELYNNAEEGTTVGYYTAGSMEPFYNALQAAYALIKDVMTMDELNKCLEQIATAVANFRAALLLPEEGKAYYIRSTSTQSSRTGKFIYAVDSGDDYSLLQGGYDVDADLRDEDIASRLNYAWTPEYDENGNIALRNVFTGRYIQPTTVNYTYIYQTNEFSTMEIDPADLAGSFNLCFGNGEYLNCNGTYVISWASATDVDSYWAFEEIEDEPYTHIMDLSSSALQPITVALPIASEAENGTIYRVLGVNSDGDIVLEEANLEWEYEVPAGTPFIFLPNEGETTFTAYIDYGFDELEWNLEPKNNNGLQGALQETALKAGLGIMSNGVVYISVDGDKTEANSGYFDGTSPVVEAEGSATITVNGEITDISIASAIAESEAKVSGVYNLAGKKIGMTTKSLPAGVYIVNGKKVIVK